MELFIKFLSQIADAVRYNFLVRILNLKITRIELERFESTIVDGLPNTFKKDFKMSRRIGARLCSTNHTAALQPLVSRSLIESDILYRVNFNLDSHHSLSLSFSPSFSVQSRLSRSLTRFLDILPLQRLLPLWMETFVSHLFVRIIFTRSFVVWFRFVFEFSLDSTTTLSIKNPRPFFPFSSLGKRDGARAITIA